MGSPVYTLHANRGLYGQLPTRYLPITDIVSAPRHKAHNLSKIVADKFQRENFSPKVIVDHGCGDGVLTEALLRAGIKAETVILVDTELYCVKDAIHNVARLASDGVLIQGRHADPLVEDLVYDDAVLQIITSPWSVEKPVNEQRFFHDFVDGIKGTSRGILAVRQMQVGDVLELLLSNGVQGEIIQEGQMFGGRRPRPAPRDKDTAVIITWLYCKRTSDESTKKPRKTVSFSFPPTLQNTAPKQRTPTREHFSPNEQLQSLTATGNLHDTPAQNTGNPE
jgi:hypothetical protein